MLSTVCVFLNTPLLLLKMVSDKSVHRLHPIAYCQYLASNQTDLAIVSEESRKTRQRAKHCLAGRGQDSVSGGCLCFTLVHLENMLMITMADEVSFGVRVCRLDKLQPQIFWCSTWIYFEFIILLLGLYMQIRTHNICAKPFNC